MKSSLLLPKVTAGIAIAMTFTFTGCKKFFQELKDERPKCEDSEHASIDALDLPDSYQIHAIGVYEGSYPEGVEHGCGDHPWGEVDVDIAQQKNPYVLVLTSYEPVQWKFSQPPASAVTKTDGTSDLVGVVLSGYHCQEVIGLNSEIPVVHKTHVGGSKDYFYGMGEKTQHSSNSMEVGIAGMFGKRVTTVQYNYIGGNSILHYGGGLPRDAEVHTLEVYEAASGDGRGGNKGSVDVEIKEGNSNKPLVLLLNSYNTVDWNITNNSSQELAAVILMSYYDSNVSGLEETTTVIQRERCWAIDCEDDCEIMEAMALELTGQAPSSSQFSQTATNFVVKP